MVQDVQQHVGEVDAGDAACADADADTEAPVQTYDMMRQTKAVPPTRHVD